MLRGEHLGAEVDDDADDLVARELDPDDGVAGVVDTQRHLRPPDAGLLLGSLDQVAVAQIGWTALVMVDCEKPVSRDTSVRESGPCVRIAA